MQLDADTYTIILSELDLGSRVSLLQSSAFLYHSHDLWLWVLNAEKARKTSLACSPTLDIPSLDLVRLRKIARRTAAVQSNLRNSDPQIRSHFAMENIHPKEQILAILEGEEIMFTAHNEDYPMNLVVSCYDLCDRNYQRRLIAKESFLYCALVKSRPVLLPDGEKAGVWTLSFLTASESQLFEGTHPDAKPIYRIATLRLDISNRDSPLISDVRNVTLATDGYYFPGENTHLFVDPSRAAMIFVALHEDSQMFGIASIFPASDSPSVELRYHSFDRAMKDFHVRYILGGVAVDGILHIVVGIWDKRGNMDFQQSLRQTALDSVTGWPRCSKYDTSAPELLQFLVFRAALPSSPHGFHLFSQRSDGPLSAVVEKDVGSVIEFGHLKLYNLIPKTRAPQTSALAEAGDPFLQARLVSHAEYRVKLSGACVESFSQNGTNAFTVAKVQLDSTSVPTLLYLPGLDNISSVNGPRQIPECRMQVPPVVRMDWEFNHGDISDDMSGRHIMDFALGFVVLILRGRLVVLRYGPR